MGLQQRTDLKVVSGVKGRKVKLDPATSGQVSKALERELDNLAEKRRKSVKFAMTHRVGNCDRSNVKGNKRPVAIRLPRSVSPSLFNAD